MLHRRTSEIRENFGLKLHNPDLVPGNFCLFVLLKKRLLVGSIRDIFWVMEETRA
jgi:hypothetical protein